MFTCSGTPADHGCPRPVDANRLFSGAGAAGEPARLRSAADRKALRGPAIGPVAGRTAAIADAAIRATGGAGGFQAAFRAAERLHHRRRRDTARPAGYGVSTLYREKGIAGRPGRDFGRGRRHLSRSRISPQPRDRSAAGYPERSASPSGRRGQHHGSGAEGRRRRAVRHPADARCGGGRTALAALRPSSGNCS